MTAEQKAAYIFAQSVAALAEIEGMKAENMKRETQKLSMAYDEDSFLAVIARYGINHNSVVGFFNK